MDIIKFHTNVPEHNSDRNGHHQLEEDQFSHASLTQTLLYPLNTENLQNHHQNNKYLIWLEFCFPPTLIVLGESLVSEFLSRFNNGDFSLWFISELNWKFLQVVSSPWKYLFAGRDGSVLFELCSVTGLYSANSFR